MKQNYFNLRSALLAALLTGSAAAFGGNIPQYSFARQGDPYTEFTDGNTIISRWGEGTWVMFPKIGATNGTTTETTNALTQEGFPIGFDFRLGGATFNQFALSNAGDLYLGKDVVTYKPRYDSSGDGSYDHTQPPFSISMSPNKHGLYRADISYKTTGEEGSRILTIQFKDARVDEIGSNKGKYSLQIRLFEADGHIEFAFKEIDTIYGSYFGFDTGLHGWDTDDAIQLYAAGLMKELQLSPFKACNQLVDLSYIHWDHNDYDNFYQTTISLTPCSDTTAPQAAPTDLQVSETETQLLISCKRAEGADATVVLVSEQPFTDADLPVDGETFRASYRDLADKQFIPVSFGNAKALYYADAEEISTAYDAIEPGKTYYVKALSVNGYPAYNRTNTADATFTTTQDPPKTVTGSALGTDRLSVSVDADYKVIVAATAEPLGIYQLGYAGRFGIPTPDAAVGDELEGGGKIVYVGDPAEFTVAADANTLTYFRAWTLNGDRVSVRSADGHALPDPVYPYEPRLEYFPYGEQLEYWTATDNQFIPMKRAYGGDMAVMAVTGDDAEVTLDTPALPLDSSVKLTFDFAMETELDAADSEGGGVALNQGSKPGDFGSTGYLAVRAGGSTYKTVTSYSGTMVGVPGGGNEDGSSTYESVEVDMPAVGRGEKIQLAFSVPKSSKLFLRNINLIRTGEPPKAPDAAPTGLTADETRDGDILVSCSRGEDALNTIVLFSPEPFTEADIPSDGQAPAIGSKIGNATVLYYGSDDIISTGTDISVPGMEPIIPDYDTDYYFRALSANDNPLYNRECTADFTYHTLPDMKYPENVTLHSPTDDTLEAEADRASGAEGTLLLLSKEGKADTRPADGTQYTVGESLGNATVLYAGTDAHISARATALDPGTKYALTAYSYNARHWYGEVARTADAETTSITVVAADSLDLRSVTIHTLDGKRLNPATPAELPAGIYLIDGKKHLIQK